MIAAIAAVMLAGMSGCSSAPSGPPAAPGWVHQPSRTVDSGYIVYVGMGEDYTPERARFKSEASAIQDLANECSFAPRGTRVEDHYDYFYGGKYQSFAKLAVSFDECEQAKATLEPVRIQALANAEMTDQLKHYQQIEYDMPTEDAAAPANPALADTNPPIQDDGTYFVARQQIAYAKEIVILEPAAYPPGSVVSRQFVERIRPQTVTIQQYEQVHPVVHTWGNSWSSFERNPTAKLPASIPRRRNAPGPSYRRSGFRRGGPGPQRTGRGYVRKRRRRRRGDEE